MKKDPRLSERKAFHRPPRNIVYCEQCPIRNYCLSQTAGTGPLLKVISETK